MEEQTLVEKLQSIDDIPDFVEVDKPREYKKLLDQYREKHLLVDKAARGEFSFSKQVQELAKKHKGLKVILPTFEDKGYDRRLAELNLDDLFSVGHFKTKTNIEYPEHPYVGRAMGWVADKLMNPVGASISMAALLFMLGGIGKEGDSALVSYARLGGISVISGCFVGLLGSAIKLQPIPETKENARYLDAKIQEIYRTT